MHMVVWKNLVCQIFSCPRAYHEKWDQNPKRRKTKNHDSDAKKQFGNLFRVSMSKIDFKKWRSKSNWLLISTASDSKSPWPNSLNFAEHFIRCDYLMTKFQLDLNSPYKFSNTVINYFLFWSFIKVSIYQRKIIKWKLASVLDFQWTEKFYFRWWIIGKLLFKIFW